MRVGTWNLEQAVPGGTKGARQMAFLAAQDADVWLLTEVHEAVAGPGQHMVLSPGHLVDRPRQHWSAVNSAWPLTDCHSTHDGLALARADTAAGPLLLASSVLPWRAAGRFWPADPAGPYSVRFEQTVQQHLDQITRARRPDEPLIWGGDANQAMSGPDTVGSRAGRAVLAEAFAALGLICPTAELAEARDGWCSIDHIAVPADWTTASFRRLLPRSAAGRPLSDHACYLGDVTC